MQYLIQLLISGLAIGAIYGLIAMGFAVIYKSTGLVNFAQGEMTMITAYIAWTISTTVSGNVFVVAIGAILAAVVLGAERELGAELRRAAEHNDHAHLREEERGEREAKVRGSRKTTEAELRATTEPSSERRPSRIPSDERAEFRARTEPSSE